MKLPRNLVVYKITCGKYFLKFIRTWVFFSTAFRVTIPDSGFTSFSLASENILLQKLASIFNQTAVFSAPKEK